MSLDSFLVDLIDTYRQNDCGDIDGFDFAGMMEKHGVVSRRPATQADIDADEWLQEYGTEPGDPIYVDSAELIALKERVRQSKERAA